MIFIAPKGLRYDTRIHDYIEPDGSLASVERVADAWEMTVEEVEQDRRSLAKLKREVMQDRIKWKKEQQSDAPHKNSAV